MVRALLFWITLVPIVIGSNAAGELHVMHSPDSLVFITTEKTSESLLKEIFSAALGLSVEPHTEWKGMYVVDPFNTPEAVVEVYIDGVSSLGENIMGPKSKVYPLIVQEYEPDTFKGVTNRIKQRYTDGQNKIVNIKLSEDSEQYKDIFGDITPHKDAMNKLVHLKHTVEEDNHFLNELGTFQALVGRIQNGVIIPDNIIDFYNIRFRTLHTLSDFYGPNSVKTTEAKKLLSVALQELSKAFVKAYDGSVLVTVVTTDVAHTRRPARSVHLYDPVMPSTTFDSYKASLRNATEDEDTNADYAAIFNIFLWFGVLWAFSLLAIIHACMDMDPGRDSIIYRMTTSRIKKDN